jgi:hypothetical protein
VGLNTENEEFARHVMRPKEIAAFFADEASFDAIFAYPQAVANGFNAPPVFAAEMCCDKLLVLRADIVTNQLPKDCLTWFATKLLPDEYTAKDKVEFVADAHHGFGPGTCRVTSMACLYPDGREATFAKKLVGVENRPALFLKIHNQYGGFHPNVAIFFPDKAEGTTHAAVKFGEAFVLAKQGTSYKDAVLLTSELMHDIIETFNLLVNRGLYKKGNNLYSTNYKTEIESLQPRLIVERNRLD